MSTVKVLVEGYAKQKVDGGWRATSTCVLIEDSGLRILVDPGQDRKLLLDALSKEELRPEDIDLVFLTHHHLDHLVNIQLFPQANICFGDHCTKGRDLTACANRIPNTNIEIIRTPGHSAEHCALLVRTSEGRCAIAGDVIWSSEPADSAIDWQELLERQDPFAEDMETLRKSRQKLLEMADYIIPGHGKPFSPQWAEEGTTRSTEH